MSGSVERLRERYPRGDVFSLAVSPQRTLADIHDLLDRLDRADALASACIERDPDGQDSCRVCDMWAPRGQPILHLGGCALAAYCTARKSSTP